MFKQRKKQLGCKRTQFETYLQLFYDIRIKRNWCKRTQFETYLQQQSLQLVYLRKYLQTLAD